MIETDDGSGVLARVMAAVEEDSVAEVGRHFVDLTAGYVAAAAGEERGVSTGRPAEEVAALFDEPMPAGGRPLGEVLRRVADDVVPGSIALMHPMYVGHQVSAPLPAAVWSEMLVSALNQSVAVREMSPVATIVEHRVLGWLAELAGFGADAGGTFTSGGTEATFTALAAARAAAMPDAWRRGVGDDPPPVLCGEHAHYAVTRAVGQLGLGIDRAVAIPSREHRMDPAALGATLDDLAARGRRPLAVVATAGSTATGSFDDLETIGALCDRHGVWLHVDGAHGASALLSARHRGRLAGIGRARSIAWDAHKMMLLPLSAGMLLVRDRRDLDAAFAQRAPYLFHNEGQTFDWDQGRRSFLCSRRAEVLKVWIALQRYGADGIAALYDRLCALAAWLWARLRERDDFEVFHAPESNILCFRHRPPGAAPEAIDAANLRLRERYNASGEGWITTTVLDGQRVLRVTIMNPRTTEAHLARLVDGLARLGRP